MPSLIQIKRSTITDAPSAGTLQTGELAYSLLSTSNSLFVGDGSNNAIRIGGGKYLWLHQANVSSPGALTSNAVVVTNGNGYVTAWKTNNLIVGTDGTTVNIASISTAANSTQLGGSAGGSNTELVSSFAIKTYVDGKVSAASPTITSTQVGFGNSSNLLTGTSAFTFDSVTSKLTIGGAVTNVAITPTTIVTAATIAAGNTTITGFANVSSTLNVVGATTVNGALTVNNTAAVGNTTVTGFANVSSFINVVGAATVNGALTVNNTAALGNTTITGFANVTSTLQVSANASFAQNVAVTGRLSAGSLSVGDTTISGNLSITGTLTTVSANNLSVTDSMIQLASDNTTSDLLDIGFFGSYEAGDGAPHEHTGLFRDASDSGVYKLFQGLDPSPTTTVDTANLSFAFATLQSFLKTGGAGASGLIANSSTIALTANSTLNVAIVANTLTLSTPLGGTSGGTGLNSYTAEQILVANSSNGFRALSKGAEGTVLQISSSVVAYGTLDGGTF